jgi:hypothetical protein
VRARDHYWPSGESVAVTRGRRVELTQFHNWDAGALIGM